MIFPYFQPPQRRRTVLCCRSTPRHRDRSAIIRRLLQWSREQMSGARKRRVVVGTVRIRRIWDVFWEKSQEVDLLIIVTP